MSMRATIVTKPPEVVTYEGPLVREDDTDVVLDDDRLGFRVGLGKHRIASMRVDSDR